MLAGRSATTSSLSSKRAVFTGSSRPAPTKGASTARRGTGAGVVDVKAGNKNDRGPFAPLVKLGKLALGEQKVNNVRGKVISLHSQVISDFCKYVGADPKVKQQLIKLAKSNGGKLGFLA